jgi:hypothetical protein
MVAEVRQDVRIYRIHHEHFVNPVSLSDVYLSCIRSSAAEKPCRKYSDLLRSVGQRIAVCALFVLAHVSASDNKLFQIP